MINSALEQFKSLINDTKQISNVYQHFNIKTLDDLLRWQWAQAIAALDKYIHDVIKVGLIMSYNKEITPTKSFSNFLIPISLLDDPLLIQSSFEQFITKKLSYISYQTPEKINEGLSLIWMEEHKWQIIADSMGENKKYVTNKLNLIAQRRNQIVHQGDYPSTNLEKENISLSAVIDVIDFIEIIVHTIHNKLEIDLNSRKLQHVH